MIDVGGPSMLRAAAKNFAHVVAVSSPDQYDVVLGELREHGEVSLDTRRELAARGVRDDGRVRGGDRELVRRDGAVPRAADAHVPEGDRPLVRREPAPGCGLLPRGRRAAASALARRAARRQGALVQQPRRPRGCAPDRARVRAAGRRDRQAREPVRRRGGGDDRGGVGARARRRSGVGIRLCRRPQPSRVGRARRAHRRALRRGAARARLRRPTRSTRCARRSRCASCPTASAVRRRRASATSSACSAACSCRSATATSQDREAMEVVCGKVTEPQWGDLLFAWRICKHVSSNAIVLAKDLQTIGIGAGQMSRVDSVRIAIEKAREHGHELAGVVAGERRLLPVRRRPATRARRGRRRRSSSPAAHGATTR